MEEHGVSTIKNLASLFGDDEAVVYVDDALGELRVLHLVRHHDDGLACPVELREYLHDAPRGIVVEVRGRLVGEEYLRLVRDRAHDGNSLLLASAKLAREIVQARAKARAPEGGGRPRIRFPLAEIGHEERERDVLERREFGKKRVVLEYETETKETEKHFLVRTHRMRVLAVDAYLPARRIVEQAHLVEKGALARAAPPHDRHPLARARPEIDALQDRRYDAAAPECFDELFCFDHVSFSRRAYASLEIT